MATFRKPRIKTQSRKLDGPRSEMNVTPLVDVCLVLLIIFMVIMPLLARGKEVPLPQTQNHETQADKNQPIIAIDSKGTIYYDKNEVTRIVPSEPPPGMQGRWWRLEDDAAIRQAVENGLRRMEESAVDSNKVVRKVFLKADETLPYGQVYPLIMAVHDTGVAAIDLATNELRRTGAE